MNVFLINIKFRISELQNDIISSEILFSQDKKSVQIQKDLAFMYNKLNTLHDIYKLEMALVGKHVFEKTRESKLNVFFK